MDLKELEKLAKLCHKYGIRTYTSPELTLNFDLPNPSLSSPSNGDVKEEEEKKYSEEDILLWSSSTPV